MNQARGVAEKVAHDTLAKYMAVSNDYVKKQGFGIFNAPVREHATLVLLSEQPGGGHFDLKEACAIPSEHLYFKYRDQYSVDGTWKIAGVFYREFKEMGALDLLEGSAVLHSNFFRAPTRAEWEANTPLGLRHDLEGFSLERAIAIIQAISPRVILCQGLHVYDRVINRLGGGLSSVIPRLSVGRLYCRVQTSTGPVLVGIPHPTGSWLSSAEWDRIRYALAADLGRRTIDGAALPAKTASTLVGSSAPKRAATLPIRAASVSVHAGGRLRGTRVRDGKGVYASLGRDGRLADSAGRYHYSTQSWRAYVFDEPAVRDAVNNGVTWEAF